MTLLENYCVCRYCPNLGIPVQTDLDTFSNSRFPPKLMGLRTLISDDKHAKWHTQCHQIIFNQSYVTYEYRALQLFSIIMVPVWCSYLCRGRKNLTMPEKNFDFFSWYLWFWFVMITKSLPIGWAIGNCTVDLTDKIKFLREIAGMLEERWWASKLEWAGYTFLISWAVGQ